MTTSAKILWNTAGGIAKTEDIEKLVRSRGLEPPRLAALAPQASASASSATTALPIHKSALPRHSYLLQPAGTTVVAKFILPYAKANSNTQKIGIKMHFENFAAPRRSTIHRGSSSTVPAASISAACLRTAAFSRWYTRF